MKVKGGSYDLGYDFKYNMVFQVIWIYHVIWDDDLFMRMDVWIHNE